MFPIPATIALVEQRLAEPTRAVDLAHAGEHRVVPGRRSEDVRPEPGKRPRVQLEHRPVPEDTLSTLSAQDEPGATRSRIHFRPLPHRPSPAHTQVRAKDDAAFEPEHEVLPERLDGFEQAAVELPSVDRRPRPRMRRFHLDPFADEHLEAARGAMERVALGHRHSVLGTRAC